LLANLPSESNLSGKKGGSMKTQNVLIAGVGGEGVLTTGVIIARSAGLQGLQVKGTQLHGLAQRGGSVPTHVRFGKNIGSPTIPMAEADLVLAIEPAEAIKACYFSSKKRTSFVLDNCPVPSVYVRLNKQKYPKIAEIKKAIKPFAKKTIVVDASKICEERLGSALFANTFLLGVAVAERMLALRKEKIIEVIKESFPHEQEKNIEAFKLGANYKKLV